MSTLCRFGKRFWTAPGARSPALPYLLPNGFGVSNEASVKSPIPPAVRLAFCIGSAIFFAVLLGGCSMALAGLCVGLVSREVDQVGDRDKNG